MKRLAVAAALLLAGCVHAPPTGARPPVVERVQAADGWPLALTRYPIPDGVPARALPILLCHGLGTNHRSLDLDEGGSLARYLAAQGFDVWAVDLRHRGESRARPKGGEKIGRINFDDYVRLDAPAFVEHILARTHAAKVVWVGHSMGGMIGYAELGRGDPRIAALVAIASPGAVRQEGLIRFFASLAGITELCPQIHARALGSMHATIFGGWSEWHLDNLIFNRDNLTPHERQWLASDGLENLTRGELKQFRRWLREDTFVSNDGADDYAKNLSKITAPALLVSGSADTVVPAPNVQFVMQRLASPDKTHRMFGKSEGDPHDWGHVDLVAGRRAQTEVFPEISAWLLAHDPPAM